MIKKSISTFSLSRLGCSTIDEIFSIIQRVGFQYVDFKLDDYCRYFDWRNLTEQEICNHFTNIEKKANEYNLKIFQTHAPYALYPYYLEKGYCEIIQKSIMATAALGAEYCVCHPLPFPISKESSVEKEEFQFNVDWFYGLKPILQKNGVTCCIENIYDWDERKIRLISFSDVNVVNKAVQLLGQEFGVCLDTGHFNLFNNNIYQAIQELGNNLKVLHIHDNHGKNDEHIFPFDGTIDWERFIKGLNDINYRSTLNLELSPQNCSISFEKLIEAKNVLGRLGEILDRNI